MISEAAEELRRARDTGAGSAADRAWILTLLAKCAQLKETDDDAAQLADQVMAEWALVDDQQERALGLGPASWVLRWAARYDESVAAAKEALELLRRSDDRSMTLRGLVFYAHALADMQDLDGTEAVLREADELAAGDPVWELTAIHADCAHLRGDNLRALTLYAESLSWTSTTGETTSDGPALLGHEPCKRRSQRGGAGGLRAAPTRRAADRPDRRYADLDPVAE